MNPAISSDLRIGQTHRLGVIDLENSESRMLNLKSQAPPKCAPVRLFPPASGISSLQPPVLPRPFKPGREREPEWPLKPRAGDQAHPLLTPRSAHAVFCRRTGVDVSLTSFYRWINSGLISVQRINSRFFVPLAEIDRIVAASYAGERL